MLEFVSLDLGRQPEMDLYAIVISLSLGLATYALYRLVAGRTAAPRGRGGLKAPPALPSLPLLGSLPFLSGVSELHTCLTEKGKRYGNVFAFYAAAGRTMRGSRFRH